MSALVINAGSSSVKFQVVDPATGAVRAKGLAERIGASVAPSPHHAGPGADRAVYTRSLRAA